MEWGRAKTILILAFLMLNLILAYQVWESKLRLPDESNDIQLIAEEVMAVAASKNIQIEAAIPTETPRMNEITVTFEDEGIVGNVVTFTEPIPYVSLLVGSDVWDVIANQIPRFREYQIDRFTSKAGTVVLHQLADEYPMFDVRLKIHYENQRIVSYEQNYVQIQEGQEATDQKVLSAYLAIGRLVENYMEPGTTITEVQLGYHGQIFNSETQVLAPMWRIMTSDNEMYYVHAINGSVETPSKETE